LLSFKLPASRATSSPSIAVMAWTSTFLHSALATAERFTLAAVHLQLNQAAPF